MGRYGYDSFQAIYESLKSLGSFNALLEARHRAGYDRHERLNEWVVLGRFILDTCGNTLKFTGENIPAVMFPDIPQVFTQTEFAAYLIRKSPNREVWLSVSIGSDIPSAHLACPVCKEPWAVSNCHDVVTEHESRVIKLDGYGGTGTTLGMMKELWNSNKDAIWRVQPDCSIRNDQYISGTNKTGWIAPEDDYQIHPGDEAMVNVWTYRHHECHRQNQLGREQAYFGQICPEAGFTSIRLTPIANQYCPCDSCAPWFEVVADGIAFTIGWRKRVISIQSTDPRIILDKMFSKEETTKSTHEIHAWGREKCIEYLSTIRENR